MTRNEFITSWVGADDDTRFANFITWVDESLSGVDDLLPPISIIRNPAESAYSQVPPMGHFQITPDYFQVGADSDDALVAGDAIVYVLMQVAMEVYYMRQQERLDYEKDYRKEQDKITDKLLKGVKPKGSKAGYGAYLYIQYMKKLEYGSG